MENTFGSRLKQLRQEKNLRQEQIASLVGLNRGRPIRLTGNMMRDAML